MTFLIKCALPILINQSDIPWNKKDDAVIKRAAYVCLYRYNGCTRRIIKKKNNVYHIICGESNE